MRKLIFCAIPKELHFAKDFIMKFAIEKGYAPLSAYGIPFWLLDTVERDKIREVNYSYLVKCAELWAFSCRTMGVSDGVGREIEVAIRNDIKVRKFINS